MRGVGIVWFFCDSMANILSQFRIAVYSNKKITYSTNDYYKSEQMGDLAHKVVTSKSIDEECWYAEDIRSQPALQTKAIHKH